MKKILSYTEGKFMAKRWLSFALICLLLATAGSSLIFAQIRTDNTASSAKIKADVAELAVSGNRRIEVKMLDGTKRKGDIGQASEDSFILIDSKTKQAVPIAYADIAQVKNRGAKGDKIAVGIFAGAGVVGAIVLTYFLVKINNN